MDKMMVNQGKRTRTPRTRMMWREGLRLRLNAYCRGMSVYLLVLVLIGNYCVAQKRQTIVCDTIYTEKGYSIHLEEIQESSTSDKTKANVLFTFCQRIGGRSVEIFRDSVFSSAKEILFEDFNMDGVKDILVQHDTDVRSNWSYYLYLVDIPNNLLKKIIDFENIKNPIYLPKYNLVSNLVMSGTNWSGFYQIQGNRVRDFEVTVDEDNDAERARIIQKIVSSKDWLPLH
jgi:hypothetical protein